MQDTRVTIVVVPRDHFSDTRESLESIYTHSDIPFSLVYVDGRSPRLVARYLKQQAAQRSFRLIRTERYLSPNHARNIGAAEVETPYLVFIDNDVVVAPDWLGALVRCADETGAAVVGPLNFECRPLHTIVHFAGGLARIESVEVAGRVERHLVDRIFHRNPAAGSTPTDVAEFHCMLVRTEAFRAVGGLDERMLSTRENLDFCMMLREAGHEVRLEPASKVTYLPPERLHLSDIPFFALRWSDQWDMASFRHFITKWNLTEDDYFAHQYRNLGWRRHGLMLQQGLLSWLPSWKLRLAAARSLQPLERRLNRAISQRYARRHLTPQQS